MFEPAGSAERFLLDWTGICKEKDYTIALATCVTIEVILPAFLLLSLTVFLYSLPVSLSYILFLSLTSVTLFMCFFFVLSSLLFLSWSAIL